MVVGISEVLSFLLWPFLMCLVLVGIHCYLGFHVLTRGVIFVDLSLAQVAAFGSTLAFFWGLEHDGVGSYFVSLGFTVLAAGLFALARSQEKKIPQEAIIGITYALGSAAVVLVVDRMAHGTEHIKSLLVGQVLWVSSQDVVKTAVIYSIVGLIHFVFRRQFFAASEGKNPGNQAFWDFLFYTLFGVVITSSVRIAGVLQVFSYLIVPSVVANLFFDKFRVKLFFGWAFGFVMSLFGMGLSYYKDLPSGACIVVLFTLVPVSLILFLSVKPKSLADRL
jgi:zinc/manganese transport system permease protein